MGNETLTAWVERGVEKSVALALANPELRPVREKNSISKKDTHKLFMSLVTPQWGHRECKVASPGSLVGVITFFVSSEFIPPGNNSSLRVIRHANRHLILAIPELEIPAVILPRRGSQPADKSRLKTSQSLTDELNFST
ncbi:hypothetical protein CCP4SC76_7100005 [Gammaproteobacteria bacterium]